MTRRQGPDISQAGRQAGTWIGSSGGKKSRAGMVVSKWVRAPPLPVQSSMTM